MQQLHFLGRTPMAQRRREALTGFLRSLAQMGPEAMPYAYTDQHLRPLGFSEQEIQDFRRSPEETRRRLLADTGAGPELVSQLERRGASSTLINHVQRFAGAIADVRRPLCLDRCEQDDDGSFAVSYHLPEHRGSVADGDDFFAGVSLTGNVGDGSVTVAPRVVRQICTNGLIGVTDETSTCDRFVRDAQGGVEGQIEGAVETGLSCETVNAAVARMRTLRAKQVEDAIRALEAEQVEVPSRFHAEVRRVYEANGEHTAYGAFNALTQTARDARHILQRVRIEQAAGKVLRVRATLETESPLGLGEGSWH